jgi:tryptophan-rich sensory protein
VTAALVLRWKPVAVAAIAATLVASLGGLATQLGPWYDGLTKPPWQPPDWLFGPAWTVIFALIAAAGVVAWSAAGDRAARGRVMWLFALNGFLNVLWSVLFFHLQRPDWALVEVIFLWLSILLLIAAVSAISRLAGWLLVPYLAWVTFASILNLAIVRLNQPFG